jgi:aminoglycoside phosphotransferase (APT) family kinase protein
MHDRQLEAVVEQFEPGATLRFARPLQGGISANMSALDIGLPNGRARSVVLRQPNKSTFAERQSAAAEEFAVLRVVHQEGLPVPEPLLLDVSGDILPDPYLLLSYLDGHAEYSTETLDTAALKARMLARIHRVAPSLPAVAALRRPQRAFASRLQALPPDPASPVDEWGIRQALEPFWTSLPSNHSVLLHGDYWPGNLLWKNGRLVGVVDWEDASIGDPLADLAISRLDTLLIFGADAMAEFTSAYASVSGVNMTDLPYWDLCAALRDAPALATWAVGFRALGRPDLTEARLRDALIWFTDQAMETLAGRQ